MLRLLLITAHPDDEAGGFGGALQLYRDRGVETYVICLTPGEAATNRGAAKSNEELASIRREEFRRACELLRVTHAEVLDHRDGALDREDFFAVTGELVRRIRQIRPQVVMTFGAEGAVTAHPDHGMASLFATAAFQWAGRSNRFVDQLEKEGLAPYRPQKLYYGTALFTLPERQPIAPPPVTATLDIAPYLETKIKAFATHTSQNALLPLFEGHVRQRGPRERFHLAAAFPPRMMEMETDLFAGVVEE